MIKLKSVTINKYKSIETEQSFDVEDDVTVLVGKNESGKTAILEAISKSNPYSDKDFKYDITNDYPRQEQQEFKRTGEDKTALVSRFAFSETMAKCIGKKIGQDTLRGTEVTQLRTYRKQDAIYENIDLNIANFWEFKFAQFKIEDEQLKALVTRRTPYVEFVSHFDGYTDKVNENALLDEINEYFDGEWMTDESIASHLVFKYLHPRLPKYLFYDEYHQLPSEIDLYALQNDQSGRPDLKTARALFQLANLDVQDLLASDDEETITAREAAGEQITRILREYWTTNSQLRVQFHLPRATNAAGNPYVKIRVSDGPDSMTLPLESRSRGFRWFFSFFVWFSKIQEDAASQYILLLDEPGLHLHASAQRDLMRFIEDLAENYQVVYTTHSPFMIRSDKLHQVRTVLETENGTRISKSLDEDDRDTLFPLQAALGYNIAQNLFIGENNLIVEGISDIIYLRVMSAILKDAGRTGLQSDIVVVPVGGFGNVATFVSLLHGNELNMACLLDRVAGSGGEQEVNKLIKKRLIKAGNVMYFNSFAANGGKNADVEDMFAKCEYLDLFNETFDNIPDIAIEHLDKHEKRIVKQIQKHIEDDFNHYRPAYTLSTKGNDDTFFSKETLNRFEKMFKEVNSAFDD